MLFDYIGWSKVSDLIMKAVEKAIANGQVTIDFAKELGVEALTTRQFSEVLLTYL